MAISPLSFNIFIHALQVSSSSGDFDCITMCNYCCNYSAQLSIYISRLSGDVNMKSILRDPVFWAFMGCFVAAIALGTKA